MFAKNSAAALVALVGSVAAHAQSSTVTVYGNIDASVGTFEDDLSHRITKVESGVLTGSFLGFKGQEDLGSGLKAFFKLESTLAVDTGAVAGNFWSRTSEIGLAGSFGTVTVGNSLSLAGRTNHAQSPFSVFGRLNGVQTVASAAGFGATQINSLTYVSQNYSGFSGAAQFGASEVRGTDNTVALQGNYGAGPVAVGLTYTDAQGRSLWQLSGSYDYGSFKGFAQIGQANIDASPDVSFFELGASAPVTAAGTVLASWTHSKVDHADKRDELSVAYDHALSKRTGAYAGLQYVQIKPANTESRSGLTLAVGVHHAF